MKDAKEVLNNRKNELLMQIILLKSTIELIDAFLEELEDNPSMSGLGALFGD